MRGVNSEHLQEGGLRVDSHEVGEARIKEMTAGVAKYMRGERELYFRHSEALTAEWKAAIGGYFHQELLGNIRTVILQGARIPPPPFYTEAKKLSGGRFPDFVHMASITYLDVIVFHDEIKQRTLFHGLVHAAQMAFLGFERYVDLYVRGFAKNRSWLAIALEDQAYKLDARFANDPTRVFSVENEIKLWAEEGRFDS
jgi:hypothetical protein